MVCCWLEKKKGPLGLGRDHYEEEEERGKKKSLKRMKSKRCAFSEPCSSWKERYMHLSSVFSKGLHLISSKALELAITSPIT